MLHDGDKVLPAGAEHLLEAEMSDGLEKGGEYLFICLSEIFALFMDSGSQSGF